MLGNILQLALYLHDDGILQCLVVHPVGRRGAILSRHAHERFALAIPTATYLAAAKSLPEVVPVVDQSLTFLFREKLLKRYQVWIPRMDRPSSIKFDQPVAVLHPTKEFVQITRLQRIEVAGTLVIVIAALRLCRQQMTRLASRSTLEHHHRLVFQVGAVSHGGHLRAEWVV